MAEPRDASSRRETLLRLAAATKVQTNHDRRLSLVGLFRELIQNPLLAESEVFEAAYDDPKGSQYWAGWFADDFSSLYQFVSFIEAHQGKPVDISYISRSSILEAFSVAAKSEPSWLKGNIEAVINAKSHPALLAGCEINRRRAAYWILGHPEFSEILPRSIRSYLENKRSIGGIDNFSLPSRTGMALPDQHRRKRGPRPDVRERVKAQMREFAEREGRQALETMQEEAMATIFGAVRDTCRKARREWLAETPTEPRQTPTNDK